MSLKVSAQVWQTHSALLYASHIAGMVIEVSRMESSYHRTVQQIQRVIRLVRLSLRLEAGEKDGDS